MLLTGANSVAAETSTLPILKQWTELPVSVIENKKPVVLMIEQSDCIYCERVKEEFLQPLSKSDDYGDKVHIVRVSLDSGEYLQGPDNKDVETTEFCGRYEANFSPTVLFLNGQGQQIAEKIVGINSSDFYGYYLEKSLKAAIAALQ
ncbi:MAG: thioredoxin fold domain-containing protein [Arenicella sp.]